MAPGRSRGPSACWEVRLEAPRGSRMTQGTHAEASALFEQMAHELERAAQHFRTAARHMHDHDVPRACAHAFSAQGHMVVAQEKYQEMARIHASKSIP